VRVARDHRNAVADLDAAVGKACCKPVDYCRIGVGPVDAAANEIGESLFGKAPTGCGRKQVAQCLRAMSVFQKASFSASSVVDDRDDFELPQQSRSAGRNQRVAGAHGRSCGSGKHLSHFGVDVF